MRRLAFPDKRREKPSNKFFSEGLYQQGRNVVTFVLISKQAPLVQNFPAVGLSPSREDITSPTRFGQTEDIAQFSTTLKGFGKKDLEYIKGLTSKYHYGRDIERMMEPETRMHVYFYKDKILLRNFSYLPFDDEHRWSGVCNDLSWDLENRLKEHFGNTYRFARVYGTSPEFFNRTGSEHVFLLGWKPEQEEKILAQVKAGKVPNEALLIDPSFGFTVDEKVRRAYSIIGFSGALFPNIGNKDYDYIQVTSPGTNLKMAYYPLGFLRDLDNEAKIRGNPLVFIGFKWGYRTDKPKVVIGRAGNGSSGVNEWPTLKKGISENSPLNKFILKLKDELQSSPPEQLMQDLDAHRPVEKMPDGAFYLINASAGFF